MNEQTAPTGTPGTEELQTLDTQTTDAELAQLRADVDAATARAEAAEKAASEATGTEPRYAVYDKTYLRYLPGVHDKRTDAEKAAKAIKGLRYRIDEV
jgi:hypothetical protein